MAACPNCQQPLPDPPESFCPSCGAALGAGLSLPPRRGGGSGPRSSGGSIPWEEREQRGFVAAFFESTKEVLTGPTSFFQRMPVEGGIPSPLLYGVLAGYVGYVAQAIYGTVLQGMFASSLASLGSRGDGAPVMALMQGGLGLVAQIVLGPIQVIIGLFLMSAIYHVLLMLFGGARKGFEATFRVVCFGQAASLLGVIPVCGLLAGLYALVLYVIGLSEAHGISRGKAAAVVLLPILLVCCCCGAALLLAFGGFAGLLSQIQR